MRERTRELDSYTFTSVRLLTVESTLYYNNSTDSDWLIASDRPPQWFYWTWRSYPNRNSGALEREPTNQTLSMINDHHQPTICCNRNFPGASRIRYPHPHPKIKLELFYNIALFYEINNFPCINRCTKLR